MQFTLALRAVKARLPRFFTFPKEWGVQPPRRHERERSDRGTAPRGILSPQRLGPRRRLLANAASGRTLLKAFTTNKQKVAMQSSKWLFKLPPLAVFGFVSFLLGIVYAKGTNRPAEPFAQAVEA